ncbi:MAG TPA: radical SAM protein [Candidatus Hydrogenedentes bacterium]|nr:radical SAM protein [Candidatus Hydrogenedentota bacterium]HPC16647.1 radical SAM protein [Candidatus Hydrogenedentota bacterium]HRT22246.1 radical SAM protein [Candidatus Hydrogenedentota bacterium]HRT63498.1 radical SAM protein [Candidatus Hydrogenedentota bacterium]
MEHGDFKYVFGPVVSRRLGRSLGVDVVPFKTCTYDCIYCQLGRTTCLTLERGDFVPLDEVIAELKRKIESGVAADYITIAGSGEPTLYSRLGELIHGIKKLTTIPVAVLTNGSLLWDADVQKSLLEADVVIPSLDASTPESYRTVNRPCADIPFDKMIGGLVAFRERFGGQYWLEVLLLQDVAENENEVERLAGQVARIRPDRVQLHTVARPSPGGEARPATRECLERIALRLGPNAKVVMPSNDAHSLDATGPAAEAPLHEVSETDIFNLLLRHPCTVADIAAGLHADTTAVQRSLDALLIRQAVRKENRNGETFYLALI